MFKAQRPWCHSTLGLRVIKKKKKGEKKKQKKSNRARHEHKSEQKIWYHCEEREFFVVNLLVRIHLIIEMFLVDRPCAMGF